MAGVIPSDGESVALEAMLNVTAPQDLVLRLFTNDVEPNGDTAADELTEASGSGYAPIALAPMRWSFQGSRATYPTQTFTFNAPAADVHGYYITQAQSGRLIVAERLGGKPHPIALGGDGVEVTVELFVS